MDDNAQQPNQDSLETSVTTTTTTTPAVEPQSVTVTTPSWTAPTPTPSVTVTTPSWGTPEPTSVSVTTPTSMPPAEPIVEVTMAPPVSMTAPVSTPMGMPDLAPPSTPVVQTTVTQTPPTPAPTTTVTEEVLPAPRSKGASPLIIGVIAVLFVGVAAGATYMISQATSSQQAVAPTAPTSEPLASEPTPIEESVPGETVEVDCSDTPGTEYNGKECVPVTISDDSVIFAQ